MRAAIAAASGSGPEGVTAQIGGFNNTAAFCVDGKNLGPAVCALALPVVLFGAIASLNMQGHGAGNRPYGLTVTGFLKATEFSDNEHAAAGARVAPALRSTEQIWALKRRAGLDPLQALAAVNLAHVADLPVGWLSAGQRRRTALARLLVAERPLWLLDEPTTALDAASQARLAQSMAAHRAKGGMIIAATHAPVGLGDCAELRLGAAS